MNGAVDTLSADAHTQNVSQGPRFQRWVAVAFLQLTVLLNFSEQQSTGSYRTKDDEHHRPRTGGLAFPCTAFGHQSRTISCDDHQRCSPKDPTPAMSFQQLVVLSRVARCDWQCSGTILPILATSRHCSIGRDNSGERFSARRSLLAHTWGDEVRVRSTRFETVVHVLVLIS